MATGHLRKRIGKNGDVSYQITVEGDRDPVTGARNRQYDTVRGSKKQAEATMRKMISDLENGTVSTASTVRLSAWLQTWLNTFLPNIEPTTRSSYEEKIKNHINPHLGHLPLNALNASTIQSWINALSSKGLSPKTIRNTYNNLNGALKKAVKLRMIPYTPCEGTTLPKMQKYQACVYDTALLQQTLTLATDLSMYAIILLGGSVGLRRGEIAALLWEDIDFINGTISITKSRVNSQGKVIQKAPKSQAGNRTIRVGNEVLSALRTIKVSYDALIETDSTFRDLGYVVFKKNGEPFSPDSITQKWERFVAQNNLPSIRLHDLRHSNATALIAAGVSAKVVQHRLGHADVGITLNTYTHVLPSMDEDAAEKIDQILFSTTSRPIPPPQQIP